MSAPPAIAWEARGPLRVPLLVDSPNRYVGHGRETVFRIWNGGPGHYLRHERRPGWWSTSAEGTVAESAMKRRLSDTSAKPTRWYRRVFQTDSDAREAASEKRLAGLGSYVGDADRYIMRVLVEHPETFTAYPMTRPLRILTVDVEQRSTGGRFPARDAPLVSIALGRADGSKPRVVVAKHAPECPDPNACECEPDDAPVLRAWRRAIEAFDPDIIAAYNAPYDIGVLAARAALHGYPIEEWGRVDEDGARVRSLFRDEKRGRHRDAIPYVGGRIVWDLRRNANPVSDYNLSGCKDFKLKTVGAFLGLPILTEDTTETLALWRRDPRRLVRYNANDVVLLEHLIARYLPDRLGLAEFYGAPLDMVLDTGSGWSGTIASARALYAEGILSDGSNFERHREWLKGRARDEPDPDDEDNGVKQFAGAHIVIYQRGLFQPIFKVDFASLYPNVLIATRAGPDNTRIVGTEPLGEFRVDKKGATRLIHMPDTNYGHNWLIEVRGTSAFTPIMAARMKERLAAKTAGDEVRANILKTQLNAMFGTQGALFNRYGVMPVAIIAAGYSRELIRAVEDVLGDSKVETDTDGVYVTREPDVAACNKAANALARRHGFEPRFTLDTAMNPAGYFHERKTYLLLATDGRTIKRYGVAMKGRSHPALFDHIMENVGGVLLRTGDRAAALAVAREHLELSRYAPRDFIQRATLGKPIESYPHRTKEVKIALAHEAAFGTPPKPGTTYEYVRTPRGNVPPTPENLADLDQHAYLTKVCLKALSRLGFENLEELGVAHRVKHLGARTKRAKKHTTRDANAPRETSLFSF